MTKKLIIIIIAFVVIISASVVGIIYHNKTQKFYLEDNYYYNGGLYDITSKEINKYIKNKESFVLFTYNDFCTFSVPCDSIFEDASKSLNIQILQIPYRDFKKTVLDKEIDYGPSIIIIKEGKVVKYLDAESDKDKELYQDVSKFKTWISKYIYTKKEKK